MNFRRRVGYLILWASNARKPAVPTAGFHRGRSPARRVSNTTSLAGLLVKINDLPLRVGHHTRERVTAMADYRIDCVNKPDRNSRHEHITHVGGPKPDGSGRWKDTVPNVVRRIEQKIDRFYTSEAGVSAWVGVRASAAGTKYLQTHADGVWKDNLLALKECG